jgi:hypothetical protein
MVYIAGNQPSQASNLIPYVRVLWLFLFIQVVFTFYHIFPILSIPCYYAGKDYNEKHYSFDAFLLD